MRLTNPLPPKEHEFEALRDGLREHNESFTGAVFREKISSFVKDETGKIVGGILGEINWGWLHIQGLWIDKSIRKGGWGTKLLSHMEEYALSKDTSYIRLETTTFQALDFYLKSGYSVFGELPNLPPGHTSYFLQKQVGI
jgi:ribosomal protein S18 acetylase RimI-like enzyme